MNEKESQEMLDAMGIKTPRLKKRLVLHNAPMSEDDMQKHILDLYELHNCLVDVINAMVEEMEEMSQWIAK